MVPLVFNYQVGNPNATYPPSLTVKSTDAGVSVLNLAPTHKYVAFGLASTPPLPPSFGTLIWSPTSEYIQYYTTSSLDLISATYSEFQTVDPTTVGAMGWTTGIYDSPIPITSISNFAPYTNLSVIYALFTYITELNLEDIQLKANNLYPTLPLAEIEYNLALSSITNLPTFPDTNPDYSFYGNNLPKTSIDNILIELDNIGALSGTLDISNGGGLGNNDSFTPGGAGESAYTTLLSRSWTITYNIGGLPQLDSNNNALSNTIASYIYNDTFYYNSSIDTFNGVVVGNDYEGVTSLFIKNTSGLTTLSNLYSYINLTSITAQSQAIQSINLNYNISLTEILMNFGSLIYLSLNNYYKNLRYIYLNNNALNLESVESAIYAAYSNGKTNGILYLNGGTNAAPSGAVTSMLATLVSRGWTVGTN